MTARTARKSSVPPQHLLAPIQIYYFQLSWIIEIARYCSKIEASPDERGKHMLGPVTKCVFVLQMAELLPPIAETRFRSRFEHVGRHLTYLRLPALNSFS
jgi:hypothetical protein